MHGQEESIEERVLSTGEIIEIRRRPTINEKKDAAELVIAYLEGKPHQTSVVASVDLEPTALPDGDLQARVAEILARFAGPALAPAIEVEATRVQAALPAKVKG